MGERRAAGSVAERDEVSSAISADEGHDHERGAILLEEMRQALSRRGVGVEAGAGVLEESTLLRFLRARSMEVERAAQMLAEHQKWRAAFVGPLGYVPEALIPNELAAHKIFLQGLSKSGWPLLVILARKHFKSSTPLEVKRFIVYTLDKTLASAPPGVEKYMVIVDVHGIGFKNVDVPTTITGFQLLQNYYPERLGKLVFVNASKLFHKVWQMCSYVLDVATKQKVMMLGTRELAEGALLNDIDPHVLPSCFGGEAKLVPLQDVVLGTWPPYSPPLMPLNNCDSCDA